MCGICGIIAKEPLSTIQYDACLRMNQTLYHRGPDGMGGYRDSHLALAMRRLSIIDLTGGWQPLYNEDQSIVLIANAEIYNFIELRQQLESRGHHFRTRSDCEIIVHLYEEYRENCVDHFRGMFAFALWDKERRRLMLARDRMGEKPLYLFEGQGYLIFASEIKALMASGVITFDLDPQAVDQYFHYQYVPEPATAIKGVRKLPAAHFLTVDLASWNIEETCYWRMEDAPPIEADPATTLRSALEEVSEIVIRSDVPVGVALSSGLDSSAIAALAVKKYPDKMHAFCVGYPGRPSNDERAGAKALADYIGMPFHDIELTTPDMVAFFPDLVYWRDDPIADISGYGYYAVMKLAREHGVPVILQGQGGDELFWGYPWVVKALHESMRKANVLRMDSRALLSSIELHLPEDTTIHAMKKWMESLGGLRTALQSLGMYLRRPREEMIFYNLAPDFPIAARDMRGFYTRELCDAINNTNPSGLFTLPLPWPRVDLVITRLICESYLRENGIAQGDRLAMASSVELRLPLVDYRLVETVIGLRKAQADHHLPPKAWLRSALKGVLPDWVMNRPKQGFAPPLRDWHDALFKAYGSFLRDGFLVEAKILKRESANYLAEGPFERGAIMPISFKALVLETWCRKFTERRGAN